MVCKVKFQYRHKITSEQKLLLERLVGDEVEAEEDTECPGLFTMMNTWKEYHVDPAELVEAGIFKFEVSEVLDTPIIRVMNKTMAAVDRLNNAVESMKSQGGSVLYNERCGVHVPGLGLLLLNEVMVLKDCCTDILQEHLDAGWRIVATCPQPDSRRPDYVIGRTKP